MNISTRNKLEGTVKEIHKGAVNDEIVIAVSPELSIVAIITDNSTQGLGLKAGAAVVALIKASSIALATDVEGLLFSARNQCHATVTAVHKGAVNSEVQMDAGNGVKLSAVVTNTSVDELRIVTGSAVTAIFKASSVIVAAKKS